ncbi:hypothetical protein JEQ12_003780, partial [Ovis aries]
PVTAAAGDPTAATPATAVQVMGAATPSAACVCVKPAMWARGVRSPAQPTRSATTAARPAPALMGPPVTLSMGSAAVALAGQGPPACRPAHLAGLERPVPSAASAPRAPPATTSPGSVTVPRASRGPAVSKPAHLAPLGSAVGSSATAPARTRPATPPRGPVRAPPATTAPAASNGARQGGSGLAASCCVGVSTGAPVTRSPGPAAAPPDSLGLTAAS